MVAISFGGAIGCWARYGRTDLVQAVYGTDFPYATLSINLLGSLLMGFLFIETLERVTISPVLRTGILTGGLGGFTTFSTFEMESLLLVEKGEPLKTLLYVLLSVGVGFIGAFFGAQAHMRDDRSLAMPGALGGRSTSDARLPLRHEWVEVPSIAR
ncbi:MAG: fluoride efflux transporter CrcB [Acetobacteraceae bacterium]